MRYADSVFINCPFDDEYRPLLDAVVFAILDCGFVPRCALEVSDSGIVRLDRLVQLITASKYGIHDISRVEPSRRSGLPRFNMAFELGLFLGAKRFGRPRHRRKTALVL